MDRVLCNAGHGSMFSVLYRNLVSETEEGWKAGPVCHYLMYRRTGNLQPFAIGGISAFLYTADESGRCKESVGGYVEWFPVYAEFS